MKANTAEAKRGTSVASVTVAFNAATILPRQMDVLLAQSHPPEEILVVDNGSTDGTAKMLAERYPQVKVLQIQKNGPPGSAMSMGMAYAALEKRHDWVWIFDADSIPEPKMLQHLLDGAASANGASGRIGMVSPLLVHKETGEYYPPLYWRDGYVKPDRSSLREPILFVDLVLGSGLLIRREVVETIGLLHDEMVMYFQDFEYCLRARAHGYKIAVVTGSQLTHEVGRPHEVRLPGFPKLWSAHAPWQEYYMSRNLAYAAWHLYPNSRVKRFFLRHQSKHAVGVLLFSRKKMACLARMVQGIWDGCVGRLGMRVPLGS